VNILTLVTGLDLVAALLISFGGIIGKVSPLQLVIMTMFECVFYAINKGVFLAGYLDFIDGKTCFETDSEATTNLLYEATTVSALS
jgi:hypothetical protein